MLPEKLYGYVCGYTQEFKGTTKPSGGSENGFYEYVRADIYLALQDVQAATIQCLKDEADSCKELTQRIAELEAELARYSPVPVDECPEEWKDGRVVLLFDRTPKHPILGFWSQIDNEWMQYGNHLHGPITHVSIPFPPQQEADRGDD